MTDKTGLNLRQSDNRPMPPTSSYWVNVTREGLNVMIRERRSQQRSPSEQEARFDPMIDATAALSQDHPAWQKTAR